MWNLLSVIGAIATRRESTHAAVALGWLRSRPEVSTILVGARTVAQLDDNLKALSLELNAEDLQELEDASKPDYGYPYAFIGAREPW